VFLLPLSIAVRLSRDVSADAGSLYNKAAVIDVTVIGTPWIRTTRFKIREFYVLPTQCIYVFCVDIRTNSDYFPTALTDWFL
jgi:hypothetical protein